MLSTDLFPGRVSLHPREIALACSVSIKQVDRWIETGHLDVIRVSIGTDRSHHRITVSSYDRFILKGGTGNGANGHAKHGVNGKVR